MLLNRCLALTVLRAIEDASCYIWTVIYLPWKVFCCFKVSSRLMAFLAICSHAGWIMVFKVVSKASPVYVAEMWNSSARHSEDVNAALDTTSTYEEHYKNGLVLPSNWTKFNPKEVWEQLYKLTLRANTFPWNGCSWLCGEAFTQEGYKFPVPAKGCILVAVYLPHERLDEFNWLISKDQQYCYSMKDVESALLEISHKALWQNTR